MKDVCCTDCMCPAQSFVLLTLQAYLTSRGRSGLCRLRLGPAQTAFDLSAAIQCCNPLKTVSAVDAQRMSKCCETDIKRRCCHRWFYLHFGQAWHNCELKQDLFGNCSKRMQMMAMAAYVCLEACHKAALLHHASTLSVGAFAAPGATCR